MRYETKWHLLNFMLLAVGAFLVMVGFGWAGGLGLCALTLYVKLGDLED